MSASLQEQLEQKLMWAGVEMEQAEKYAAMFGKLEEAQLQQVVTLFESHPELIQTVIANINAKQAALVMDDKESWQKIIEAEKDFLASL